MPPLVLARFDRAANENVCTTQK